MSKEGQTVNELNLYWGLRAASMGSGLFPGSEIKANVIWLHLHYLTLLLAKQDSWE